MNRRHFLMLTPVLLAGCSKKPVPVPPPPEPTLSPDEAARVAAEQAERTKFIASLDGFRAATGEKRETPKPAVDMIAVLPELKPMMRIAVRLHPRYGEEMPPNASKIGGRFLWPDDAKWPLDPVLKIPMVPVLQLCEEHAPTQFPFRPVCDVLQLFWTARDPMKNETTGSDELTAQIVWRRAMSVTGKTMDPPSQALSFPSLMPVPCRLHPEWVGELPDWDALKQTALRPKLQEWMPPEEPGKLSGQDYYARFLSSAPGSKVGGWSRVSRKAPGCATCQWPMDYLLTIDTQEWTPSDAARWRPTQDPDDEIGRRAACGLKLKGGRAVEIYLCRRCEAWPVRALVV
ncbi:hypothetical protein BH11PLA2_BH11PLA2_36660 [soil metagenome]